MGIRRFDPRPRAGLGDATAPRHADRRHFPGGSDATSEAGSIMNIRVMLIDDSNLFRQGLRALISATKDCTIVADMRGGKEAIQAAIDMNPDVVLLDVTLADVNGLDSVSQIKRHQPQIKIVMLTTAKTEAHVREALRAGADGYVLKDASIDELLLALRCVTKGKKYLSPDVSGHMVESFLNRNGNGNGNGNTPTRLEMLTTRERSILQLIAEGRTNRTAAEFLSVSPKTVEKHRSSLMHKLGLRNAAELTLVALELGLIERPFAISRLMNDPTVGGVAA
jgi:DNA-binding NarL/FixJ family response regulator